jgi:hypothetical protein
MMWKLGLRPRAIPRKELYKLGFSLECIHAMIAGDGPVPGSEGHVVQDLEPGGEQRRGRRHGRRLHPRLGL